MQLKAAMNVENASSILTYVICILVSATIYRYRHLLGMIIVILFGASWLFAATMMFSTLRENASMQAYILSSLKNMVQIPAMQFFESSFNADQEHTSL